MYAVPYLHTESHIHADRDAHDGDGKRVQSVMQTNYTTTTTHFVGNYYEVTGSSISLFICASITGLVYGIVSGMLLSGRTPTRWVLSKSPRRF